MFFTCSDVAAAASADRLAAARTCSRYRGDHVNTSRYTGEHVSTSRAARTRSTRYKFQSSVSTTGCQKVDHTTDMVSITAAGSSPVSL